MPLGRLTLDIIWLRPPLIFKKCSKCDNHVAKLMQSHMNMAKLRSQLSDLTTMLDTATADKDSPLRDVVCNDDVLVSRSKKLQLLTIEFDASCLKC